MHPDVPDPEIGALAHRLVGDVRPLTDHDGVNAAGDRVEIVVCAIPLYFFGVRIDREHVIAAVAQPLVDGIAARGFPAFVRRR